MQKINAPMVRNRFEMKLLKCDLDLPPTRRDGSVQQEGIIQCFVRITSFPHL